ncbi:MAG: hypothetical protein FWD68_15805 [Alphaproteobacteria bacterium]|nr:hypothetical protein [Alphaproteobacteria bacterium]
MSVPWYWKVGEADGTVGDGTFSGTTVKALGALAFPQTDVEACTAADAVVRAQWGAPGWAWRQHWRGRQTPPG